MVRDTQKTRWPTRCRRCPSGGHTNPPRLPFRLEGQSRVRTVLRHHPIKDTLTPSQLSLSAPHYSPALYSALVSCVVPTTTNITRLFTISINQDEKDFVLFSEISPNPGHSRHSTNTNKKPKLPHINGRCIWNLVEHHRKPTERQFSFLCITLKESSAWS